MRRHVSLHAGQSYHDVVNNVRRHGVLEDGLLLSEAGSHSPPPAIRVGECSEQSDQHIWFIGHCQVAPLPLRLDRTPRPCYRLCRHTAQSAE